MKIYGRKSGMERQAVRVRYKSRDGGWQEREWLYFAPADIQAGDIVKLKTKWGEASAIVSAAGISPENIAPEILCRMQSILGREEADNG